MLDVGGGPGVHARWLAEAGHAVELVDPMPSARRRVRPRSQPKGSPSPPQLGDARALTHADDACSTSCCCSVRCTTSPNATDRVLAWREALRVVQPGGLVIAAAVNRFASLFAGLA